MLNAERIVAERGFRQIRGLRLSDIGQADIRSELHALWIEHGVILFRDCESTPEMQVALSRIFGEPEQHPFKERLVEGHPELLWVRHIPGQDVTYDVDGAVLGGWLPWHSDLAYMASINRGGILRAIQLPDEGGKTGFIDQIEAYNRLPPHFKAEIEGLSVVYTLNLNAAEQKFGRYKGLGRRHNVSASVRAIDARRANDFPDVVHPLVYVQRETGRKVLNLSPWFADHVLEMPGAEGDDLLAEVARHCVDPELAYYHSWRPGDMMLWDNWRTLHCATGVAPDAVRILQRTTLKGDYQLGRVLHEGATAHGERVDV